MVTSLRNNKCLNSVLKLWFPLIWLFQPGEFKLLYKQFCTFLMIGILHTQYESTKFYIQELNLWLALLKGIKACVRYFLSNFYFSPNKSPSKTMTNAFCFI